MDEDVDIFDADDVPWAIVTFFQIEFGPLFALILRDTLLPGEDGGARLALGRGMCGVM